MAAKTVRMNRLSKIVCISAVLGALMILTDGTSRAMLGLGFLMYIRCSMRTEEVCFQLKCEALMLLKYAVRFLLW